MSDSAAMNLPAYFVESGPAAGVVAAAAIAMKTMASMYSDAPLTTRSMRVQQSAKPFYK